MCTCCQNFVSCMNFIILVKRGCACFFDLWNFYILALFYLEVFLVFKVFA